MAKKKQNKEEALKELNEIVIDGVPFKEIFDKLDDTQQKFVYAVARSAYNDGYVEGFKKGVARVIKELEGEKDGRSDENNQSAE